MNIRGCLFCAAPLTERAHVVPQWLIDYLGVRDEDLFQGIAQTRDGALLKQRTHTAESVVEGRVCKQCYTGWISSLENQVRPFLMDLMTGQRTLHALSAEERLVLGRWTAKTAFVLSNAGPLEAVVPEHHPRTLRELSDTLPAGVGVFANQHEHTRKFSYVQKNHWLRFSEEEQPEHPQRYKIALQLQKSSPARRIWPIETLAPSYYPGIDLPRPHDSRSLLMRFSDTLAILHPMKLEDLRIVALQGWTLDGPDLEFLSDQIGHKTGQYDFNSTAGTSSTSRLRSRLSGLQSRKTTRQYAG